MKVDIQITQDLQFISLSNFQGSFEKQRDTVSRKEPLDPRKSALALRCLIRFVTNASRLQYLQAVRPI